MADVETKLRAALPDDCIVPGEAINDDYTHDEALTGVPVRPLLVVLPTTTADVASILRVCDELRVPVTARGAGTGLSGACIPRADGIVVSLERMNAVLEIDDDNHVAVVQPGVT